MVKSPELPLNLIESQWSNIAGSHWNPVDLPLPINFTQNDPEAGLSTRFAKKWSGHAATSWIWLQEHCTTALDSIGGQYLQQWWLLKRLPHFPLYIGKLPWLATPSPPSKSHLTYTITLICLLEWLDGLIAESFKHGFLGYASFETVRSWEKGVGDILIWGGDAEIVVR